MDAVKELQLYMLGLVEILLGRLQSYYFISPHILLVVNKSKLILEHLIDQEIHGEAIVKSFEMRVDAMMQEAMDKVEGDIRLAVQDINAVIKGEIKWTHPDPPIIRKVTQISNNEQQQQNSVYGTITPTLQTSDNGTKRTQTTGSILYPRGFSLFAPKELDQMTLAKSSHHSKTKYGGKLNSLMVNKHQCEEEELATLIEEDDDIDLDKINKYFENVVNEHHFLHNYGEAKARNAERDEHNNPEEGGTYEEWRAKEVAIAKKFMRSGLTH